MSEAEPTLAKMAEALRSMPEVIERVMPKLRDIAHAYLYECYRAGKSPDGVPWELTNENDRPRLRGEHVSVVHTQKGEVRIHVEGHEGLHHAGLARGRVKRPMIPETERIPPELERRWRAALEAELMAAMRIE